MTDRAYQLEEKVRHIEAELVEVKKELRNLKQDKPEAGSVDEHRPAISEPVSPAAEKVPKDMEQIISDWLPRVFILVFVLGIIWAFIAAMDRGILSPPIRVLAGFVVSGLLYGSGHMQFRKNPSALSIVLLGGSIVVYIASVFAGNVLYQLIPYSITLILLAAGMVAGVWMSRKYASQSLLAIIGLGAYLYPFLFAGDRGTETIFYLYETLIFAGLVLESMYKRYKVTWNIANYAFIFAVVFFAFVGAGTTTFVTLSALAIQQLLIIYLAFKHHTASKEMYIPAISTGALFLYLIGLSVFGQHDYQLYSFYFATAAVYGGLSLVKSKSHTVLKNTFFVFSMFYLFLIITELLEETVYVQMLVYIFQAAIVYYLSQKRNSLFGTIASFLVLIMVFNQLSLYPGRDLSIIEVLCWLSLIGFFLAIYCFREKAIALQQSMITIAAPYIIAGLLLYFFGEVVDVLTYRRAFDFDIALSISWMVFVAMMYAAYSFFKEKHWQYLGLAFLLITLAKIILYDLTTIDIVWRAVLFISLGVIGLFISRIYYNQQKK
ncbi:DUF2339 domain-containing protein [Sediminibacillus dalangtanensis]|uniref:DUF2339 domain-containing protein n=1 Tax=Sediminibacillus dalangtanensis TaxID=2729421 RepID=A0ABX7VWE3_9BACI|nr:DUF2339 domain-containing protein [Sediminibacillus dalangtanensis]QTN00982.1 DUF2339 domain-containing protein [Sediminibacillus dalangtanensis]